MFFQRFFILKNRFLFALYQKLTYNCSRANKHKKSKIAKRKQTISMGEDGSTNSNLLNLLNQDKPLVSVGVEHTIKDFVPSTLIILGVWFGLSLALVFVKAYAYK